MKKTGIATQKRRKANREQPNPYAPSGFLGAPNGRGGTPIPNTTGPPATEFVLSLTWTGLLIQFRSRAAPKHEPPKAPDSKAFCEPFFEHRRSLQYNSQKPRSCRKWRATIGLLILASLALPHSIGTANPDHTAHSAFDTGETNEQAVHNNAENLLTNESKACSSKHSKSSIPHQSVSRHNFPGALLRQCTAATNSACQDDATRHPSLTKHTANSSKENKGKGHLTPRLQPRIYSNYAQSSMSTAVPNERTENLGHIEWEIAAHYIYDNFVKPIFEEVL